MQKVWTLRLPFLCAFFTNTYCGFNFFIFLCVRVLVLHLLPKLYYNCYMTFICMGISICICMNVCVCVCEFVLCQVAILIRDPATGQAILPYFKKFRTSTHIHMHLVRYNDFLFVLHISQFFVVIFSCCS